MKQVDAPQISVALPPAAHFICRDSFGRPSIAVARWFTNRVRALTRDVRVHRQRPAGHQTRWKRQGRFNHQVRFGGRTNGWELRPATFGGGDVRRRRRSWEFVSSARDCKVFVCKMRVPSVYVMSDQRARLSTRPEWSHGTGTVRRGSRNYSGRRRWPMCVGL
jgi:hypothetical protein